MAQEGIVENSVEESNSFALGDSFISFSDTPSSPLSNKRALTDVDKPASNKKITIDRDVTASHVKKVMNTPKSLKNKGKLSKRKG
jgi:phosphoenolpyruvate synthase/pyruvate phosphate dikinase